MFQSLTGTTHHSNIQNGGANRNPRFCFNPWREPHTIQTTKLLRLTMKLTKFQSPTGGSELIYNCNYLCIICYLLKIFSIYTVTSNLFLEYGTIHQSWTPFHGFEQSFLTICFCPFPSLKAITALFGVIHSKNTRNFSLFSSNDYSSVPNLLSMDFYKWINSDPLTGTTDYSDIYKRGERLLRLQFQSLTGTTDYSDYKELKRKIPSAQRFQSLTGTTDYSDCHPSRIP